MVVGERRVSREAVRTAAPAQLHGPCAVSLRASSLSARACARGSRGDHTCSAAPRLAGLMQGMLWRGRCDAARRLGSGDRDAPAPGGVPPAVRAARLARLERGRGMAELRAMVG